MKKTRLDNLLVAKGLVASREKARGLILAGEVLVDGMPSTKAGAMVRDDATIVLKAQPHDFVSRGALKLLHALTTFGISVEGKVALDIGASTGGFTDVLLRHGARKVYAIDVGYGQLAWSLRQDPRVVVLERENIRYLDPAKIDEVPDLAVIDVSFISLGLILQKIAELLGPPGDKTILCLVKPQFEVGRGAISKGGVVRDEVDRLAAVEKIRQFATHNGFAVGEFVESPVIGPAGNHEYLLHLKTPSLRPSGAGSVPNPIGEFTLSTVKLGDSAAQNVETLVGEAIEKVLPESNRALIAQVAWEKCWAPNPPGDETRVVLATLGEKSVGVAIVSGRWIRLLYVAPEYRGRGLGDRLVQYAEAFAREQNQRSLRVADQPGNYLLPGVPVNDVSLVAWLKERGFEVGASCENLTVDLHDNPRVSEARQHELLHGLRERGVLCERASLEGAKSFALIEWISQNFSFSWGFEVSRAMSTNVLPHVHVAYAQGELCGFAAINGNNTGLGWFGPAGTLPEYRGQGIGEALLLSCLLDARNAGISQATIAWVGPRPFYEKSVGVVSSQGFVRMEKPLL